jgi:predicted  nucleic acid-binding Zn-ribbon protein
MTSELRSAELQNKNHVNEIAKLKKESRRLKGTISELKDDIEDLESDLKELRKENLDFNTEKKFMQRRIVELQDQLKGSSSRDKQDSLDFELAKLKELHEQKEKDMLDLEKVIADKVVIII